MTTKWSTIREAKGAPAMKRRVVYVDDESWEFLRGQADEQMLTMSEVLRRNLRPRDARVRAPVDYNFGKCVYCEEPATDLDHIVPRARGGTDEPANLVPACSSCNSVKALRTPEEWIEGTKVANRKPRGLVRRSIVLPDEHWEALAVIAQREGRSVSGVLRRIIAWYLAEGIALPPDTLPVTVKR